MMKCLKILNYVEKSFEGKPSFILLMEESGIEKQFISNGCVFVENTSFNRGELISEFGCEDQLSDLLKADSLELPLLTDGSYMFKGCNLTEFNSELPLLTDGSCMFEGCNLTEFNSELPLLTNGACMFYGCNLKS